MTLDVQLCRNELDELEAQLGQRAAPNPPGFDLWRHKMHSLIGEILDPNHSLAIRLVGLTDRLCAGPRVRARVLGQAMTQAGRLSKLNGLPPKLSRHCGGNLTGSLLPLLPFPMQPLIRNFGITSAA